MDDYEAIRQLSARYNRAFDERDIDAWLDCFTVDARFEFVGSAAPIVGRDALREVICTSQNNGRHVVTDFVITVDGDRASQSCHLTELGTDDHPVVRRYGRYEDELVKHDTWRFQSRKLSYG